MSGAKMEQIEKAKTEAIEMLRSIQTLDDLEEHIEEIKDMMEAIILAALDMLQSMFEGSLSQDEEARNEALAKIQDESLIFDPEIDKELSRIAEIPGAEKIMDPFNDEMEERMTPHMEKLAEFMMKFMSDMMGGMMDGMADAMGGMADAMGEMSDGFGMIEEEEFYEPSDEVRELTFSLPTYLNIRSAEELHNNKGDLFADLDELFNEKVENINIMFEMQVDRGEIGDAIKKLAKTRRATNDEINMLIGRIKDRTNEDESLDSFREEFTNHMQRIEGMIKDVKREFLQNR